MQARFFTRLLNKAFLRALVGVALLCAISPNIPVLSIPSAFAFPGDIVPIGGRTRVDPAVIQRLQSDIQRLEPMARNSELARKNLEEAKKRLAALQNNQLHGPVQVKEEDKDKEKKKSEEESEYERRHKPYYFTNTKDLVDQMDWYAINVAGMQDVDGNRIADWREVYIVNVHDCASHSATADWLLQRMAEDGFIDYHQGMSGMQVRGGTHAANYVDGIGFFDVTPVQTGRNSFRASDGTPWYNFNRTGYTLYQQGFPDAGEYTFPGYKGPGARTMPFATVPGTGIGSGGGLLGGAGGAGFSNMLRQLSGGGSGKGGGLGSGGSSSGKGTSSGSTGKSTSPQKAPVKVTPVAPAKGTAAPSKPADSTQPSKTTPAPGMAPVGALPPSAPSLPMPIPGGSQRGTFNMPIPDSGRPKPVNSGLPSAQSLGSKAAEILGSSSISPSASSPSISAPPAAAVRPSDSISFSAPSRSPDSAAVSGAARPSAWDIPAKGNSGTGAIDQIEIQKGFF